ncbi:MAG: hypothetical protein AVDCRST_MAG19-3943 [uncultured Thermomicrobiales bacterium]|uniref:Uncharacterized protein n=1 Tax=uncultured Thermomicrobiales bacterium TaxID=1645740 RepID=A0A6J4VJV1_9BACT|nr:MAG: hypothetical protein AVDCRST_MAG19-3943 [uncultured Thermomicrobiales bacterium]
MVFRPVDPSPARPASAAGEAGPAKLLASPGRGASSDCGDRSALRPARAEPYVPPALW